MELYRTSTRLLTREKCRVCIRIYLIARNVNVRWVEIELYPLLIFTISSKRMTSFTPSPLYPRGKNPKCTLDRSLGGLQIWPGRGSGKEHFCACRERNFDFADVQPLA
jgi:hypothetical protein